MNGILEAIGRGDRVTIVNRFGQERTGKAVMRGPAGWVLNMGGRHGQPAIATEENITKVRQARHNRDRALAAAQGREVLGGFTLPPFPGENA